MAKKKKTKKKKSKSKSKSKLNFRALFVVLCLVVSSLLYLPAAILLIAGMMPTFAAYLTDDKKGRNKTFTIGALNFSACFYYLISIWRYPLPMDRAMEYLSDPVTIVIIYMTAGVGYLLNYVCTVMISSILRQKSAMRLEKLENKKKDLIVRWGEKVNGARRLNSSGFFVGGEGASGDSKEE